MCVEKLMAGIIHSTLLTITDYVHVDIRNQYTCDDTFIMIVCISVHIVQPNNDYVCERENDLPARTYTFSEMSNWQKRNKEKKNTQSKINIKIKTNENERTKTHLIKNCK